MNKQEEIFKFIQDSSSEIGKLVDDIDKEVLKALFEYSKRLTSVTVLNYFDVYESVKNAVVTGYLIKIHLQKLELEELFKKD